MKLSNDKCKIVGIQLGEIRLSLIADPRSPAVSEAKFALVGEDGLFIGSLLLGSSAWNDNMRKALEGFIDVIEQEALNYVFDVKDGKTEATPEKDTNEPPQF